jgi:hypothetical protein
MPTRIVFRSGGELVVQNPLADLLEAYSKQLTDEGGIAGFTRHGRDQHHVMVNLLSIDYLEELTDEGEQQPLVEVIQ